MKINPHMVVMARQVRGYNQKKFAERVGKTPAAISKIEKGILIPNSDTLARISNELNFPKDFFLSDERQMPMAVPLHRKKTSLSKGKLDQIEAFANLQRIHIERMVSEADRDTNIPSYDIDDYHDPAEIARYVRSFLKLPRGPIDNLVFILEKSGIFVVDCEFGTDKIDGFYLLSETPIIFINKEMPGDRRRFTLAHELGHLVMHRYPSPTCEDEANLFASEFLMPEEDISYDLQELNFSKLYDLKRYWRTSMQSIIFWASKIKAINENRKKYLFMQMSSYGYRRKEPIDIPAEKPKLLKFLIDYFREELGYTIRDLARILHLTELECHHLYMPNEKGLRLVHSIGK